MNEQSHQSVNGRQEVEEERNRKAKHVENGKQNERLTIDNSDKKCRHKYMGKRVRRQTKKHGRHIEKPFTGGTDKSVCV